jgi:hypothetical protein
MVTMTQDRKTKKSIIKDKTIKKLDDDTLMEDTPAIYKMYKITLDSNATDMESNFYKKDVNG